MSWCRVHFVDDWPDIASFSRVWVYNLLSCLGGAPSLTRGWVCPSDTNFSFLTTSILRCGPQRKRLFYYCVFSSYRGNNVHTDLFSSNVCFTLTCLRSRYLAMGLHVTICRIILYSLFIVFSVFEFGPVTEIETKWIEVRYACFRMDEATSL
jgi:hypothetical protein